MNMRDIKKLNEVKAGDKLYCIAYELNDTAISVVEITAKEVITDGPRINKGVYSREAIIIEEKVPNSSDAAGNFVIDQYCHGDECYTHKYNIYTTYPEAAKAAMEEIMRRSSDVEKEIKSLMKKQKSLLKSASVLSCETEKRYNG